MSRNLRRALPLFAVLALLAAACSSISGGPKKVIVNQTVCQNAAFLRLTVDKTHRIVLDNTNPTPGQVQFTLRIENAPFVFKSELPPNSKVGNPNSTLVLQAKPGEEKRVDIQPRSSGVFEGSCIETVGGRTTQTPLSFQFF